MKILVVTCSPWRDDYNIGNSYSNLFCNMQGVEFASVYLSSGTPQNNIVKRYFQMDEKGLIANFINRQIPSGRELNLDIQANSLSSKEINTFNKLRILRLRLFFWTREFIWKIARWKSPELEEFIHDFQPDIIFAPLQDKMYLNDILVFIKKLTNKPMVTYAWDDVYSLKQISLSPLYWIDRFMQRSKIRKTASLCEYLYVISDFQKQEYEKLLDKECKLLYKGYNFNISEPMIKESIRPIKLLYTGNIASGRWKSLAKIGKELRKINKGEIVAQLYIYSLSQTTQKIKKSLNIPGSVFFMGGVSSTDVNALQNEADILVHVEPLNIQQMLVSRLSFSTKLVDYFYKSKCIFAVGKKQSASIDYLIKNDAAIVATDEATITERLENIVKNPSIISEYARKSWECGKRNHQIDIIQSGFYDDLNSLVKEM